MSMTRQAGIILPGYNPLLVANAPTIGTATAGVNSCASVAFTAPSCTGGSVISTYTAYCTTTGTNRTTGASSPLVVTGLTAGTSYTFRVVATNIYGPSYPSAASNSITATQLPTSISFLVISGGGGGGSGTNGAGGGGAGGYRSSWNGENSGANSPAEAALTGITAGTYTVTVGAGGAIAAVGGNSTFWTVTSTRGGVGGNNGGGAGGSGGSGGGGGGAGSPATGGAGTANQGRNGGNGNVGDFAGGGGGGAVGVGGAGSGCASPGFGGSGQTSTITGSSVTRAGGGGGRSIGGSQSGSGGAGGGGAGGFPATANTGGGGGGNSTGGSGLVVIKYADTFAAASSTTGSPTYTVSGGFRTYIWTTSGSITF